MKNLILFFLTICLFAAFFFGVDVLNKTSTIFAKTSANKVSNETAPRECVKTFEELFQYLYKGKKDIVADKQAQDKWLSKNLKEAFIKHINASGKPEENPDFPSNSNFIGAWDYPTSYSVVGSRSYGKRAIVDVSYKWGKGTNYEGDERLMSFIFVLEDKSWKLDDVYTFRGEYTSEESLANYFKTAKPF